MEEFMKYMKGLIYYRIRGEIRGEIDEREWVMYKDRFIQEEATFAVEQSNCYLIKEIPRSDFSHIVRMYIIPREDPVSFIMIKYLCMYPYSYQEFMNWNFDLE
jgi:hypothetical protein